MILKERQSARLMTENMRFVSKRNMAGIESVCMDLCFGEQAKPKRCVEYKKLLCENDIGFAGYFKSIGSIQNG